MIPGVNPAQARQLMKKMGIKQNELDALQVIIKLPDKELVFDNPSVSSIVMSGQETFQLTGEYEEVIPDASITIADEDIKTVMEQGNCDEDTARRTLEEHNGDIAGAIMSLSNDQ